MKNYYQFFFLILIIVTTGQTHAQWNLNAFPGTGVGTLKYVNGKLFAYSGNDNTGIGFLYMSSDTGTTWQRADSATFAHISLSDISLSDIGYDSAHNYYLLVTTGQNAFYNGIYYSIDGLTWTQNSGDLWSGDGITFINGYDVLSSAGDSGVAITGNGGTTWTASNTGLPGPPFNERYVTRIGDTCIFPTRSPVI